MTVVSHWEGDYRCRVHVRGHTWTADEPESVGGSDAGPTPTELLLGAVASCFTMALAHVARKRSLRLPDDLEVHVEGEYEGPRFARIAVRVHSETGDLALVQRLLEPAARVCYVSNTLADVSELDYEVVGA